MAKRISDKQRVIAFFTTANEQDVKDALETVNAIATARGFGKKRKATEPKKPGKSRQPASTAGDGGKPAATDAKAGAPAGS
jgi:hypothetical protein